MHAPSFEFLVVGEQGPGAQRDAADAGVEQIGIGAALGGRILSIRSGRGGSHAGYRRGSSAPPDLGIRERRGHEPFSDFPLRPNRARHGSPVSYRRRASVRSPRR
jgi:hypothetical protein